MNKDVSVIICTWNSASRLRITLNALAQCHVPSELDWELVLVNNNCTDDTDVVAADFKSRLPLEYVHEARPGLSNARNAGLAAASGKLIIFTDDDVRPEKDWLAAYWSAYSANGERHYFGGPVASEFEEQPSDDELLRLAPWSVKGLDWGEEVVIGRHMPFIGPNWACPREALDEVGGFDASLGIVGGSKKVSTGEESDVMRRLRGAGYKPCYLPKARLYHFVPSSKIAVSHIAARQEAYGYYRARILRLYENTTRKLFGVPFELALGVVRSAVRWQLSPLRRQSKAAAYVQLRRKVGEVQGTFHTWKETRQAPPSPLPAE